ncbi:MAG: ACP S-malonyltransferase [Nitrospinota bacterium]
MGARVGFLFPGQGSQKVGMGRDFYEAFPLARDLYEEANQALGWDVARLSFEGPDDQLQLTLYTQPAILVHSYVAYRLLRGRGFEPLVALGHSLGEYSALLAAGAVGYSQALRIVQKRGEYMHGAVPPGQGAMAAILGLERARVEAFCRGVQAQGGTVEPANYNAPQHVVVAGERGAVEAVVALARAAGARRAILLAVSAPFHCTLMRGAQERLARELERVEFQDLRFPVFANVSARKVTRGNEARVALSQQVTSPVFWEDSLRSVVAEGVDAVVEMGPGRVLSGLSRRIAEGLPVFNVEDVESLERTAEALAALP